MSSSTLSSLSKRITNYSFIEIKECIKQQPVLLFPLGALEPVGTCLPLGTVNIITEHIVEEISSRLDILLAPLFSYGYSTPFQAFSGCSGLNARTYELSITNCCRSWLFHGIKRIIIFTAAMDSTHIIESAATRLNETVRDKHAVSFVSLQDDLFFRTYCGKKCGHRENGRSEWGVNALAKFIRSETGMENEVNHTQGPDAAQFTRWRKRGRDPEKLRALAPDAFLSPSVPACAQDGEDLFTELTEYLCTTVSSFIAAGEHAS